MKIKSTIKSRLTLLREKTDRKHYSEYQCECGKIKTFYKYNVLSGKTLSCGCYHKERIVQLQGGLKMQNKRLSGIFHRMKDRCLNMKAAAYKYYGGAGVKICKLWLKDYANFYYWALNNGYKADLSIERINVFGNYKPSNCKWIPMSEQYKNKRKTIREHTKLKVRNKILQFKFTNVMVAQLCKVNLNTVKRVKKDLFHQGLIPITGYNRKYLSK